mgnify:CR=1 FL=1
MKENRKLLREVLKDIRRDMTDEEVLNLLADSKISENLAGENEKYTLGQRAADAIAKFAGSWAFIFAFTGVLILWMLVNTLLAEKAFAPYPLPFYKAEQSAPACPRCSLPFFEAPRCCKALNFQQCRQQAYR